MDGSGAHIIPDTQIGTGDRRHAKDVADWCQRELDTAHATGNLETRPFVQNAELIIKALREYAGKI